MQPDPRGVQRDPASKFQNQIVFRPVANNSQYLEFIQAFQASSCLYSVVALNRSFRLDVAPVDTRNSRNGAENGALALGMYTLTNMPDSNTREVVWEARNEVFRMMAQSFHIKSLFNS